MIRLENVSYRYRHSLTDALADRRQHFFDTTLADLFTQMDLLDIPLSALIARYRKTHEE